MIDSNILNSLKSNLQDPSYSTIITDFIQPDHCNKDELQIVVEQINPNLFDVIANQNDIINTLKDFITSKNLSLPDLYQITPNTVVSKTLQIESIMDYDTSSSMFISGLIGQVTNENEKQVPSTNINGKIYYNRMHITKPDSPQYLNFSRFNVKKKSITINVPDIIQDINVTLQHDDINVQHEHGSTTIVFGSHTYTEITDKKIIIDLESICADLFEEYNVNDEIAANNELIEEYTSQKIDKDESELTTEEQNTNEELDSQIEELNTLNESLEDKNTDISNAINKLNFGSNDTFDLSISYHTKPDITEQHIESIVTELSTTINIDFEYEYETLPAVILTVDERKKIYSSYALEFKQEGGKYVGVVVYLKNLKRSNQQNDINITIIGD